MSIRLKALRAAPLDLSLAPPEVGAGDQCPLGDEQLVHEPHLAISVKGGQLLRTVVELTNYCAPTGFIILNLGLPSTCFAS